MSTIDVEFDFQQEAGLEPASSEIRINTAQHYRNIIESCGVNRYQMEKCSS